ncbi:CopG family transcriptional regulator [Erwinia sp. V71]|uniref:ribbon-helix-helix domain-containing protein n=1 Tax=Erwinia sp. V71 TaxID=3369424 RepID=UPI003F5F676B
MSRLTLDLSKDVDDRITDIAHRHGITKAEAIRRAFALLSVADNQSKKSNGYSLGIVRESETGDLQAIGRVTGIFLWKCRTPGLVILISTMR